MTAGESAISSADDAVALASVYADARNYARAEQVLREALTVFPDSTGLLANLARVQVLTKDYLAATQTAHAALAISPEDAFAMRIYAVALDGAGWLDQAVWMAWQTATTHPHDRIVHYVYAELLLKVGRPHDALTVVHEALRLDPASSDSHVLRGQILARLNMVDASTASYEEALRLEPDNASAVNNIAVNRLARSKLSTALRGFLGAARLDPQLADLARRNIGVTLARMLRFATIGVVVLAYFLMMLGEDRPPRSSLLGMRIMAGLCTAGLIVFLAWLSRVLPMRTWRSVMRIQPAVVLRLGLILVAIPVGVLATVGRGLEVVAVAGPVLLLGAIFLMLIGRLTGG